MGAAFPEQMSWLGVVLLARLPSLHRTSGDGTRKACLAFVPHTVAGRAAGALHSASLSSGNVRRRAFVGDRRAAEHT